MHLNFTVASQQNGTSHIVLRKFQIFTWTLCKQIFKLKFLHTNICLQIVAIFYNFFAQQLCEYNFESVLIHMWVRVYCKYVEKIYNQRFKTSRWYFYVGHKTLIYFILILISYLLGTEAFFAHHFWPTTHNNAANEMEIL